MPAGWSEPLATSTYSPQPNEWAPVESEDPKEWKLAGVAPVWSRLLPARMPACVRSDFWAWAASEQQVFRDMKSALILPLGSRAPAPNLDSWTPED